MSYLLVEPYLIDLVRRMDADGFPLTIAGGLGIYLKRRWVEQQVREHGRRNLFDVIPEARPTVDIDAFLTMAVFMQPTGDDIQRFRQALEELGYEVHEKAKYFQFVRRIGDRVVKLDLHARVPGDDGERTAVKYNPPRVGSKQKSPVSLHAYGTPEAFAIEERPQRLPLVGNDPNGRSYAGTVQVPHPFAALCMKLQAALDHERAPPESREPRNRRHAFDAYLLVSMLDSVETEEFSELTRRFLTHEKMIEIRGGAADIFGSAEAPGCRTIEAQARDTGEQRLDLARFSRLLGELLAV